MASLISKTTPRKLTETSYVWKKEDGNYVALDPMSRIDAFIIYSLSLGLKDLYFSGFEDKEIKRYLRKRGLPENIDDSVVDEEESCFSGIEGIVNVRSFNREKWKEKKYYTIAITNLTDYKVSFKEKRKSLLNLDINCGCKRSRFQSITRPSGYQRKIYHDTRRYGDLPGGFTKTVICTHACIALDYLTIFHDREGFGIFGLPLYLGDIASDVIKLQLRNKNRIPNYQLNPLIRSYVCRPLRKFLRPRYYY